MKRKASGKAYPVHKSNKLLKIFSGGKTPCYGSLYRDIPLNHNTPLGCDQIATNRYPTGILQQVTGNFVDCGTSSDIHFQV